MHYCPYIALPFPTCIHLHNNSLIPRSSPPPTVVCKITGEGTPREEAMYRYQMLVFVKQYNLQWVCAILGECSAFWGEREGVVWWTSVP